jgi:hypothetical protein
MANGKWPMGTGLIAEPPVPVQSGEVRVEDLTAPLRFPFAICHSPFTH